MPRDVLDSARRVVCIYDEICRRTREAIRCWEIIAKRRGFHKDIYPIVSAILWERRVDADYYLEPIRRGPDRAAKRRKE